MDAGTIELLTKIAQNGPAGAFIVISFVLFGVCRHFYNQLQEERKRYEDRLSAVQDRHKSELAQAQVERNTVVQELNARIATLQHEFRLDVAKMQERHASELKSESDARHEDAKQYAGEVKELQDRVHQSVDHLADLMDRLVPPQKRPQTSRTNT